MIKVKGLHNTAKIFTDNIEEAALKQVKDVLDKEWSKGLKIRVMPDVHVGYGVPIGYTQTIKDKVIPNFVGVDIGCGMLVTKLSNNPDFKIDFNKLEKTIKSHVPSGFNVFKNRQDINLNLNDIIANFNYDRALRSVGTLGGGNHFIEINKSEKGIYLVIHSGSRHLGVEVNRYWNNKIKPNQDYLEKENFDGYLNDMKIVQKFASINRKRMRDNILRNMKLSYINEFETIHNYIDLEHMILRKGAISARLDELVLIPINMRDGSLIAKGLGNPDWNYSAPHGAGRIMSRTEAKQKVPLEKFKDSMKDVWSKSVSNKTLDESPFVYKDINEIIENTKDQLVILERLIPLYNFKA